MDGLYQRGVGFAPGARQEVVQCIRADRHAYQPQGRKADGRSHAPHLAVAALADGELDPGRRNIAAETDWRMTRPQPRLGKEARRRRAGPPVAELHPVAQAFQRGVRRRPFDLHPVGFGQLVFRVRNARLQLAVVGEQQQTLAVVVESSSRAYLRYMDELGQGPAAVFVRELAQDIERLVEQDQHYSSSVSSCAYGGAQQHRMRSGSPPGFSMQCGVPGGMHTVSPG